jgi:ribosomal protein S18 acetylase RimI-like enzyme
MMWSLSSTACMPATKYARASGPEFRGRGLAARLLDHAGGLAGDAGARGLSIVVEDTNQAAIALYKKQGFEVAEVMPWVAYGDRLGPREWVMLTRQV